jgi:sulfhydrogenase subunit beta (sulfur reductase)
MRAVKLRKQDLSCFLECVKPFGELWGPVKDGNRHTLNQIQDVNQMDLSAIRTTLPFKKLLSPPQYSMFQYGEKGYEANFEDIPNRVIFGLHPCDIHALLIMDDFHNKYYVDPYYMNRRNRTIIIGFSCIPDEKCFCHATNTDTVEEGFDLFLTDLDEFFLVWVGSSIGDDIVRDCPKIIDESITPKDLKKYIEWREYRNSQYKMDINLTGMPEIIELSDESEIWEEEGEKCLSCGACTIVCPTCPCYNVKDTIDLNKDKGNRIREWDSCLFKEYSMVAGGHNFRESRAQRLKLRFTHKLQSFVGQYGKPACVGCGRCIATCPVDIDIATIVKRLRGEEVKV